MISAVGIDIGSQKTVMVADDGSLVLTDTGSISRPTLIAFYGKSRFVGEEAFPHALSDNTVGNFNNLIGKTVSEINQSSFVEHMKPKLNETENGVVEIEIDYNGNKEKISLQGLLGMYLFKLFERIKQVYPNNPSVTFVLPTGTSQKTERLIREACQIAGAEQTINFKKFEDCLAATYAKKLNGIKLPEKAHLANRKSVLIEMGHMRTSIILTELSENIDSVKVLKTQHSENLGSYHFDLCLFEHFSRICKTKHATTIVPGTKRGKRLLAACERLRKLLSQLPETSITVENLTDNGDVTFHYSRDEMSTLCRPLLEEFKAMLTSVVQNVPYEDIKAIEVLGGGVRMQIVHNAIAEVLGPELPLGAKFDDGSASWGAALLAVKEANDAVAAALVKAQELAAALATPPPATPAAEGEAGTTTSATEGAAAEGSNTTTVETGNSTPAPPTTEETNATTTTPVTDDMAAIAAALAAATAAGPFQYYGSLNEAEIEDARQRELKMQGMDAEVKELAFQKNALESYILEMRGAPNRKFGDSINKAELSALLDGAESWLWDNSETASAQDIAKKLAEIITKLEGDSTTVTNDDGTTTVQKSGGICSAYINATTAEKRKVEEALALEAQMAAAERAANGEDDEDHDNRRLKKADRMRMVVKNKEEGTELFQGGNYRMAAARYHKALTHAAKFFDLTPDDQTEVNNLKLSINLNITQCYLKMENWDQAIRYADESLVLSPTSAKALFRRAAAFESKRDYQKAEEDLKKAIEYAPEDKGIPKALEKVKKLIQKEQEKEKKMWSKAFAS